VRTRIIVAIAALMAASALVAAPGAVGSRVPSAAKGIDQGALTPISIALPASAASMTMYDRTTATDSANRLGTSSAIPESVAAVPVPDPAEQRRRREAHDAIIEQAGVS
jgi:hypothetical protein